MTHLHNGSIDTLHADDAAHAPATDGRGLAFEPPALLFVGHADEVVLGLPGGGLDGPYGMTEPQFEFERELELEHRR